LEAVVFFERVASDLTQLGPCRHNGGAIYRGPSPVEQADAMDWVRNLKDFSLLTVNATAPAA
jgi:hypothetical protein